MGCQGKVEYMLHTIIIFLNSVDIKKYAKKDN